MTPERPASILRWFVPAVLALCLVPAAVGLLHASGGAKYLGFEYNTDDHMVYAAWMRQAIDGHLLFDNRFTTDPQPSLTIHLYFLALGWLAKLAGIPVAAAMGRLLFTGLFLVLAHRFIRRLRFEGRVGELALVLVVFGGGLGFLFWQMFGVAITKPLPEFVVGLLSGQLPVDVWQPEAFIFPSMLTNGLFMVSLCLILGVYESFLDASSSWRAAAIGFVCLGLLMNIHSYDVLTIALVMVGFLAAAWLKKRVSAVWIARAVVIALGAALPAAWFVHVLQSDPVFQARAATETYSPNFRGVLFGYLPLMVLGLWGAIFRARESQDRHVRNRRLAGVGVVILLLLGLALAAGTVSNGYFLSPAAWIGCYVLAVAASGLWADDNPTWDLVFSWAAIGTVAIYFPGLFQRKLTMGLSVPWALLATLGLQSLLKKSPESSRKLYSVCAMLVLCASSVLWLVRDISYINQNVSNTTRHAVYLDPDLLKILDLINEKPGRKVVLALPGSGSQNVDSDGHQIPDSFASPPLPDVAPILTGLTGAYSYAGHWSETPDYGHRTGDVYRFFLSQPAGGIHSVMDKSSREQFLRKTGANLAVLPSDGKGLPLVPASDLGQVLYTGPTWTLVSLTSP
jgi:arabinosyltransferase C